MSGPRLAAAARLAVRLPFTARDVLEALTVTHDDEDQADWICRTACAAGQHVSSVCRVVRGLNSMNGERCQLGPFRRDGFCSSCGRRAHTVAPKSA